MPLDDSLLLVRFEALNAGTDRVEDWFIDADYLTSTDGFSFTLSEASLLEDFGPLEMAPVDLVVGGASQLKGRIDITTVGDKGEATTCDGRDYFSDLVECNVDPLLKLTQGMTLFDAITLAASPVGIDTVVSTDDYALRNIRTGKRVGAKKPPKDFRALKTEDLKPENGVGIYEFLNKFVARMGGTMQPTDNRKTVGVSAPNYNQEVIGEIIRTNDTSSSGRNNVISGVARRDFSSFPTFAIGTGRYAKPGASSKGSVQQFDISEAAFGFNPEIAKIVTDSIIPGRRKPGNSASLGLSQVYRLLTFKDDDARNGEQLTKAVVRAVAERLKDLLVYTCTVRGHKDPRTGAVYTVDTMLDIQDRVARVSEPMWVAGRKLRFGPGEGAVTDLTLWRKGAFVL